MSPCVSHWYRCRGGYCFAEVQALAVEVLQPVQPKAPHRPSQGADRQQPQPGDPPAGAALVPEPHGLLQLLRRSASAAGPAERKRASHLRAFGCVCMGSEVLGCWVAPRPCRPHTPLSAGTTWWHYTASHQLNSEAPLLSNLIAGVPFDQPQSLGIPQRITIPLGRTPRRLPHRGGETRRWHPATLEVVQLGLVVEELRKVLGGDLPGVAARFLAPQIGINKLSSVAGWVAVAMVSKAGRRPRITPSVARWRWPAGIGGQSSRLAARHLFPGDLPQVESFSSGESISDAFEPRARSVALSHGWNPPVCGGQPSTGGGWGLPMISLQTCTWIDKWTAGDRSHS